MRTILPLLVAVGFLVPFSAAAERSSGSSAEHQRLLSDLKYLASDELEGRGLRTEGLNAAAEYIRDAFADAGLDVTAAGGDAFQEFEVVIGAELTEPNDLRLVGPNGETLDLAQGEDFQTCSFGTSGEFTAPLVFCGYGIEAEDIGYNDFAEIDLSGKVAIIMRRTPLQDDPHGPFSAAHGQISPHAALRTKVRLARKHGAAAILFVNDPYTQQSEKANLEEQLDEARDRVVQASEELVGEDGEVAADAKTAELAAAVRHLREVREILAESGGDALMEFGYGGRTTGKSIPIIHVSQDAISEVLQSAAGKSLQELESHIDETGEPHSFALEDWTAFGETSLKLVRRQVKNVVGVLEGSGPLADETIVIGAHYDHVGRGEDGSMSPGSNEIHNGADDNASGTVALLELARQLASRDEPPARRLVFIAFTGEEAGLLGSAHYVKEPLFPLESTVAMFNLDMVGRLRDSELTIFGVGTSSVWEELIAAQAEAFELETTGKPEGFGPSDHSSFYAKKIPVLHFFTGTHNDYHRPGDDWDKVNVEGITRIIDLLEQMVVAIASAEERPDYVAVQGKARPQARSGSRPYFGSIPDFSEEVEGYAIQGVSPGSPAEKGGLQGGDVIVKLGEHPIGSLDDFDLALRQFKPGQNVPTVVLRNGERKLLQVTLATPR